MSEEAKQNRSIWSCQFSDLPEGESLAQIEESLRSGELSFWEDADALEKFIRRTGRSQADCARVLGRSQSSVANRLRVLRLPKDVRARMIAHSLTERHARALLRLPTETDVEAVLDAVLRGGMSVAETEAYVEQYLSHPGGAEPLPAALAALLGQLDLLRGKEPGLRFSLHDLPGEMLLSVRFPKK